MASASARVREISESLNTTTRCAHEMEECATSMHYAASGVTQASVRVLEQLAGCNDDVASGRAFEFKEIMTDMKASGELLMDGCVTLHGSWQDYRASIEQVLLSGRFSKEDVTACIGKLQQMFVLGGTCHEYFRTFSQKQAAAARLCFSLKQDCERSASEKEKGASTIRWAGYTAAAALGIAAIASGFLTLATGGLAAPICAGVLTLGAAGAGKLTHDTASANDALASKFRASMDKLGESMGALKDTGDNINGYLTLSVEMARNLEIALKIQVAYQRELDDKDQRIRELEAQVRDLRTN